MTHGSELTFAGDSDGTERPVSRLPSITLESGREISKASLFWILHTGGWTVTFIICTIAAQEKYGLWASLLDTAIWALTGSLISLGLRYVFRRSRRLHHSYLTCAIIAIVSSALLAPVWHFFEEVSLRAVLSQIMQVQSLRPVFATEADLTSREGLFLTFYQLPFYSIIILSWASLYFGVNSILDLESERANVANALKLADRARLRALQSNLNPHFLFNALNGIATLVREQDSASAAAMVDALSSFLRSTLQRLDTPELRVAEEIELIEQYLRIQRYRFGARLHAVVEAEQGALDALIPTMILQPLVENAIRYGVLPREAGGTLWVSVRRQLQILEVTVEDDGPGIEEETSVAFGMGLQNSTDRLKALYGTAASLTIGGRARGSGCAVVIRLPFRPAPADQAYGAAVEAAHA